MKQLSLEAFLVGPKIIWCRAHWEQNRIQANAFNKLKVEVISPIKEKILIRKIILRLNEPNLNQEIEGDFLISADKPIFVERELFFSNENVNLREYFLLNEVILEA